MSTIKIYFVCLLILFRKCSAFINIIYPYSKHISLLCSLNVSVSSNDTSIFLTLSSVVNVLTEWHSLLVCILGVVDHFMCSYFIQNDFCGYFRKTTLVIFLSSHEFVMLHNTQNTFLYCHEWDFIYIIYCFNNLFYFLIWLLVVEYECCIFKPPHFWFIICVSHIAGPW